MNVDAFINGLQDASDATMGTVSMVVDGQTFNVVWDGAQKAREGAFGGLEPDIQAQATAQAADVSSPKSLLGKRCTVDGDAFRISQVRFGTVAVTFTLSDVNDNE
jgi:hypothetical protein